MGLLHYFKQVFVMGHTHYVLVIISIISNVYKGKISI